MAKGRKNGVQAIQLKMVPKLPANLGRVYSNFAEVSQSQYDFTIRFCDTPPGSDIMKLKKGGELEVPTVVEVVLPANIIPPLINALTSQNQKYLEASKLNKGHEKNK